MGCRHGELCLGHCFYVCLIFLFLRGWSYHVSSVVYLGGCTPSEVGWETSEGSCSPLEVFVISFWSGVVMIPGVLDHVFRWWFCGMARSARGCVGFVEVWAWGGVPSGNVSAVSLEFLSMFLVLVCVGPDGLSPSPAILWLTRLVILLPLWLHPLVFQWGQDCVVVTICIGWIHGSPLWLVLVVLGNFSGHKRGLCTMPLMLWPPMNFVFPGDLIYFPSLQAGPMCAYWIHTFLLISGMILFVGWLVIS